MKGKRLKMAQAVWEKDYQKFALEELADLAGSTAEAVRQYCERGLLGEEMRKVGPEVRYGEGALFLVRRMEQLRVEYGISGGAAELILDLAARVEELESEIRSLREATGR